MKNETIQVAIIMGSDSDLPVVEAIFPVLEAFGVKYTKNVNDHLIGINDDCLHLLMIS